MKENNLNEIEIRKMEMEDISGAYEVEVESFKSPWSRKSLEEDLQNENISRYLVAEKDGEIIGYIGSWKVLDEGQITNVAVKKRMRGQGIGELLMRNMIEVLEEAGTRSIVLEVRVGNDAALKLYEKFGFKIAGKRPKYYSDNGEDAFIMIR